MRYGPEAGVKVEPEELVIRSRNRTEEACLLASLVGRALACYSLPLLSASPLGPWSNAKVLKGRSRLRSYQLDTRYLGDVASWIKDTPWRDISSVAIQWQPGRSKLVIPEIRRILFKYQVVELPQEKGTPVSGTLPALWYLPLWDQRLGIWRGHLGCSTCVTTKQTTIERSTEPNSAHSQTGATIKRFAHEEGKSIMGLFV